MACGVRGCQASVLASTSSARMRRSIPRTAARARLPSSSRRRRLCLDVSASALRPPRLGRVPQGRRAARGRASGAGAPAGRIREPAEDHGEGAVAKRRVGVSETVPTWSARRAGDRVQMPARNDVSCPDRNLRWARRPDRFARAHDHLVSLARPGRTRQKVDRGPGFPAAGSCARFSRHRPATESRKDPCQG